MYDYKQAGKRPRFLDIEGCPGIGLLSNGVDGPDEGFTV